MCCDYSLAGLLKDGGLGAHGYDHIVTIFTIHVRMDARKVSLLAQSLHLLVLFHHHILLCRHTLTAPGHGSVEGCRPVPNSLSTGAHSCSSSVEIFNRAIAQTCIFPMAPIVTSGGISTGLA